MHRDWWLSRVDWEINTSRSCADLNILKGVHARPENNNRLERRAQQEREGVGCCKSVKVFSEKALTAAGSKTSLQNIKCKCGKQAAKRTTSSKHLLSVNMPPRFAGLEVWSLWGGSVEWEVGLLPRSVASAPSDSPRVLSLENSGIVGCSGCSNWCEPGDCLPSSFCRCS